jgi:hypothetical protein
MPSIANSDLLPPPAWLAFPAFKFLLIPHIGSGPWGLRRVGLGAAPLAPVPTVVVVGAAGATWANVVRLLADFVCHGRFARSPRGCRKDQSQMIRPPAAAYRKSPHDHNSLEWVF